MPSPRITRRTALAGFAAPFVFRAHAHAAPSETVLHVSVGAAGMAGSDIGQLTGSKHLKLVAAADVDADKAAALKKKFPDIRVYADWRQMFDKEKFDSVNVSCPDHMHAVPTMRAIKSGKHVYTQKPLTQTIHEARKLTEAARDAKIVSQMGTQLHSSSAHRTIVKLVHDGAIGKVTEVYSWSGKDWGDAAPRPDRKDPVPANLNWDLWLGVAGEVPFLGGGYYHPGNWRKRLDFGTGTFGDMGCHILDPVFAALKVGNPSSVKSVGDAPNAHSWGLHGEVEFVFPGTPTTADTVKVTWYNGNRRPPEDVAKKVGLVQAKLPLQGSIYLGTGGVLYSPYGGAPVLLPADKFADFKVPKVEGDNHYIQFVEAVRGNGQTTAPFDYAGPLTEMVLLGCLATRFPNQPLQWDTKALKVTNLPEANRFVKREYRKGWEEAGF